LERGFELVEFVVGEVVEVAAVVAVVGLGEDWEGGAEEWFGVVGVVGEWVDESFAAAV
jgi:type IV secretory pathway VirB2 component (pilin)